MVAINFVVPEIVGFIAYIVSLPAWCSQLLYKYHKSLQFLSFLIHCFVSSAAVSEPALASAFSARTARLSNWRHRASDLDLDVLQRVRRLADLRGNSAGCSGDLLFGTLLGSLRLLRGRRILGQLLGERQEVGGAVCALVSVCLLQSVFLLGRLTLADICGAVPECECHLASESSRE